MAVKTSRRRSVEPTELHSWDCDPWPPTVWPNDSKKAKWVVRSHRRELIAEGALTRIGKRLVILGRGYTRWLSRQAHRVNEFESNLPQLRRERRR